MTEEMMRSHWAPDSSPPEGQRAALHRLAAAIRGLNEALMDTAAPEEDLLAASQSAEALLATLSHAPKHRILFGWAEASNAGDTHARFDASPIIGPGNPVAPPLVLEVVEGEVRGRCNFNTVYEGPPGHVHGGWVAAAFDDVLGMAQSLTGNPGMTGTLTVRYRRPTPLHRDLRFTGRVDRVDGRKIFTSGTLHAGADLCAEAEAIFVSVDFERMRQMAAER